jgi:hypothetical protein
MKIGAEDLTHYLINVEEPLSLDLVEQIGLDGSGTDGNERFPYRWSNLTGQERNLLLSRTTGPAITTRPARATTAAPLAHAAQNLADVLYRIGREWEAAIEAIGDPDEQDAVRRAFETEFPLRQDLDDAGAAANAWAEHLAGLDHAWPSVVSLVAAEILDDVTSLTNDMQKRDASRDVDELMRCMVNNGLGGVSGMVAGIFTPTVLIALAKLLTEIYSDGDILEAADAFARIYRESRRQSRTY